MSRIDRTPPAPPLPLAEQPQLTVAAAQTGLLLGQRAAVVTADIRPLSETAEEISLFMAEKVEQARSASLRVRPDIPRSGKPGHKRTEPIPRQKKALAGAAPRASRRPHKSKGKP